MAFIHQNFTDVTVGHSVASEDIASEDTNWRLYWWGSATEDHEDHKDDLDDH